MIVNPGIRRFLVSAVQRLFNSAQFYAPLTHTAIPQRSGGETATFTRATTETTNNNDGYLVTLLAGEMGFPGARRVRNLVTGSSEDLTNASWTKDAGVTATFGHTDPDGGTRASKLVMVGAAKRAYNSAAAGSGATYSGFEHFWLRGDIGGEQVQIGDQSNLYTVTLTTEWVQYQSTLRTVLSGFPQVRSISAGTTTIYVTRGQREDVTAQTTQTAGEYVSVGVPSDWAGTDLVMNGTFDTDTTGWTSGNSGVLSVVGGKLRITNGAISLGAAIQSITTVAGQKYVLYREFTPGTIPTCLLQIGTTVSGNTLYAGSIVATSPLIIEFTATTATTYIQLYNGTTAIGGYSDYDNISVKPAYYHGNFADGVKTFPTDLSGNALPTAYTYDAVSLSGAAGSYVSTPDSVAASITGDIDIRVKAALTDWTPANTMDFIAKYNVTGSQRGYEFAVASGSNGLLNLTTSPDGSTVVSATSTAAPIVTDGAILWCRVTRSSTTGNVNFYTSSDGTTWSQLGNPNVASTVGGILDNTDVLAIGSRSSNVNPLSGKIYQAQIYNGINGTLAVDFNASRYAGGTTLTGSTGETWTLNGTAVIHPTNTPMTRYTPWEARTNLVFPSEDLTHVRYVSGGGGISVVADQAIAPDGTTTADQLTASGANGTLIQDLGVIASAAQAFSLYMKRKTGTGNIDITLDGGATWTTQAISSSSWTRCWITQTLANPDVGVRIVTSGDAVYVWGLQCE